jgi:hypothetical protein
MTTVHSDIFSSEDLAFITQHKSVITALHKSSILSVGMLSFIMPITSSIRSSLTEAFGMDLTNVGVLPMRWIKGDIAPHVDIGTAPFQNTYVVYLQGCQGELLLDGVSHPMIANTGFIVKEGMTNETRNMGSEPRLIVGPMNERGEPVA